MHHACTHQSIIHTLNSNFMAKEEEEKDQELSPAVKAWIYDKEHNPNAGKELNGSSKAASKNNNSSGKEI